MKKYGSLSLILALFCLHANHLAASNRVPEIFGGAMVGAGSVALASMTSVGAYATLAAAQEAVQTGRSLPEVCGHIAFTSVLLGATCLFAGLTWEAGSYSVSMLCSTPRPDTPLLKGTGTCIKLVADALPEFKYHTHHHYSH